jgi:gliding motility-associated-like protein
MTTENVPLQLNATGGNTYNWFPNTYLNDIKSATPIFLLPTDRVSLPATFSYMVTVQNDFCTNKDTINVYVEAGKVTVYNFISPNNDGANDSWIIENEEEEWGTDYRIRIMDQNNVLVYLHEGKYEDDWKATDKYGKTLPDGTSYWYIIDNTSNHQEIRGTLNVLSNQ